MLDLMALFSSDRDLLSARGSFIIRNLCILLEAEKLYRALAGVWRGMGAWQVDQQRV